MTCLQSKFIWLLLFTCCNKTFNCFGEEKENMAHINTYSNRLANVIPSTVLHVHFVFYTWTVEINSSQVLLYSNENNTENVVSSKFYCGREITLGIISKKHPQ